MLLELLKRGKGSLDYAKNLVEFGETPTIHPQTNLPVAHVEYVDLRLLKKKTSAVRTLPV